jgi:hypothetical protein
MAPALTPIPVSASVQKLINAFSAKFSAAGKRLALWNQPAIMLIDEATKQAAAEGFEIIFGGYAEDWIPPTGQPKQTYPFTLWSGGAGRPAYVYVPKAPRWLGKGPTDEDRIVTLTALTHFCFEIMNAKNSKYFRAIAQEAKSKVIKDGATYARRMIEIEVDSGMRTGRMLDGAIYFGLTDKRLEVDQVDPSYTLLNKIYYGCSNDPNCKLGITKELAAARLSRDGLITQTLGTFYVGTSTTRLKHYSDRYDALYP